MEIEELIELISKGESETTEFKSRLEGIAEEISALANHKGGIMLIGVTDDKKIVGIPKEDIERIPGYLQILKPLPKISIDKVKINDKFVVIIRVEKSKELVFAGNIPYIRIGTGKKPLDIDEIVSKLIEIRRISFDSLVSPAPEKEIYDPYFEFYLRKREKIRGIKPREKHLELKRIGALKEKNGKFFLTNAGVLFFTLNPTKYIPGARIRVGFFNKEGELINEKIFDGPAWKIIDDSYSFIISKIERIETRIGARREKIPVYPEWSLREAITNAVAHRNYWLTSDIRIMIYPDRLIVRSPGGPPPDLDLNNPEHLPRNPILCQLLYDIGFIEKYGTGIEKMRNECEKYPTVALSFNLLPYKFEVIFKRIEALGLLDRKDREIIAMIKEGMKIKDIANTIGISSSAVIKRIEKLISMGIIKKIGRGKYIVS